MNARIRLLAVALIAAAGLGYGSYRLYLRSVPAPPTVVPHDADLGRTLGTPLGERIRAGLFGRTTQAGPKLIALTFDDGPYPVDTPQLLAVLRALHLPATFFLLGRDAEQYPGLVRAIAAQGFEIADHTQTHPNLALPGASEGAAEIARGRRRWSLPADPAVRALPPPHGRTGRRPCGRAAPGSTRSFGPTIPATGAGYPAPSFWTTWPASQRRPRSCCCTAGGRRRPGCCRNWRADSGRPGIPLLPSASCSGKQPRNSSTMRRACPSGARAAADEEPAAVPNGYALAWLF